MALTVRNNTLKKTIVSDVPKRIYLSLAFFVVFDILFVGFLIYPVFRGIKQDSGDLLNQKTSFLARLIEKENLKNSQEFYESNKDDLIKVNSQFVDPEIPIELIGFIEKNAADAELVIDILPTTTTEKDEDSWPGSYFQISAKGSSQNFLKFLNKLENGPYLIDVLSLNLSRSATARLQENAVPGGINALLSIKALTAR